MGQIEGPRREDYEGAGEYTEALAQFVREAELDTAAQMDPRQGQEGLLEVGEADAGVSVGSLLDQSALVPRFAIGTPGEPSSKMLRSVYAMEKPPGEVPFLDAQMSMKGLEKLDIATARNHLVEQFLNAHEKYGYPEPLRWLLQVDGDAVVHKGTLQRLQSWNVAAVGALCVTRYRPYQPVVYRGLCVDKGGDMRSYYVQWQEVREWCMRYPKLLNTNGPAMLEEPPEGSLHEVDWTGSHCFLVHRSVYEAIEPPWFENHSKVRWGSGSDRIFFEKVKAAGFQPRVDYSVVAGHEASMVLGMADFMAWQAISVVDDAAAGAAVGSSEKAGTAAREGEAVVEAAGLVKVDEAWVGDDTVRLAGAKRPAVSEGLETAVKGEAGAKRPAVSEGLETAVKGEAGAKRPAVSEGLETAARGGVLRRVARRLGRYRA